MGNGTLGEAMEPKATMIKVSYRFVDGYHIFTSEDIRGLYVASKTAQKAFDDVGIILNELIELKLGTSCTVEPAQTFAEFMASNSQTGNPSGKRDRPTILKGQSFIIRESVAIC